MLSHGRRAVSCDHFERSTKKKGLYLIHDAENLSNSLLVARSFAPILYVLTYKTLNQAIEIQNSVAQGLSSAIFTDRMPKPTCSWPPSAAFSQSSSSPAGTTSRSMICSND